MYGSQVTNQPDFLTGSRFGSGQIGYGPGGQQYDPSNPVVNTTSGVRPQSVTNNRYLSSSGHAMTPAQYAAGGMDPISRAQQASARTPVWRRPAGVTPSEWTYVNSGGKLGTEPAATASSSSGVFGGPAGTSPVGIGSGGSVAGATQGAQARLLYGQAPGVPVSDAARGELDRQFSDVFGAAQNSANLDLLRRGAFEGANVNLDRAKAQAAANVDWQNLMARLQEQLMGQQNFNVNALYGLGG